MQTELFDTAQGLEMNKKLPEGYNREGLNARGWLRRVCGNNVNKRRYKVGGEFLTRAQIRI